MLAMTPLNHSPTPRLSRGLSRCLATQEDLAYRLHRRGPRNRARH